VGSEDQHQVNEHNVRLVVEALRSGEFPQGFGRLANMLSGGKIQYCCLGVMCEVAIRNGVQLEITEGEGARRYDGVEGLLPVRVAQWLELGGKELGMDLSDDPLARLVSPLVSSSAGQQAMELSSLNDTFEWTFNEIADAIEASWLEGGTA
jgi:hypothetical protein